MYTGLIWSGDDYSTFNQFILYSALPMFFVNIIKKKEIDKDNED
jgi:hypothetical protein